MFSQNTSTMKTFYPEVRENTSNGSFYSSNRLWTDTRDVSADLHNPNDSVLRIIANFGAFSALMTSGKVVSWGHPDFGGAQGSKVNDLQSEVIQIYASYQAFTALKDDGSLVVWGGIQDETYANIDNKKHSYLQGYVGDISNELHNIRYVVSNGLSFAALRGDGIAICWGHENYGGPFLDQTTGLKKLTYYHNDTS